MDNELIKVDHLSFGYDKELILDDISFTVRKGDFLGIIGSNGTGKSTLIKLLLGQMSPNKGRIELMNKDISDFKDWSKIGYVAQIGLSTGAVFPATAKEIVMLNLYSHIGFLRFPKKEHYKKVENVLSLVGIEYLGNSQISKLSGGQQQRVMIARALVNDPEILILDEPTTGIDAKSEESLFNLLDYINKNLGVTIIMVTHQHNRLSHVNKLLCIEDTRINETDMNRKEIINNDI